MSLLEAWKAKCPYINALDLKRGKNRPLYSYMSSVITEGLALDTSAPPPSLPTPAERVRIAAIDTAELRVWWRGRSLAQRSAVLAFPLQVMTNPNPNPNPNPSPNPNPNPNPDPHPNPSPNRARLPAAGARAAHVGVPCVGGPPAQVARARLGRVPAHPHRVH